MTDLKEIVGLKSDEDFKSMLANGSITYGDETVEFTEQSIYVTPEEEIKVPTKTSELINDRGFITGYTETDPTVPSWAKLPTKPSYSYSEITEKPMLSTVATSGSYNDLSDKPNIPTKTSEIENDSGFITSNDIPTLEESDPTVPSFIKNITELDIQNWNSKSDFSGDYNDLVNKPKIPSVEGLASETYVNENVQRVESSIPKKVSELENDSEFVTETVLTDKGYATTTQLENSSNSTLDSAKAYADEKVANLVGTAPETLDTLQEVATAIQENDTVVQALNSAIGNKANTSDVVALIARVESNETNISSLQTNKADRAELFSGSYDELTNKPTLFSGSYNDLTDKPTIPDTSALEARIATKASQTSLDAEISERTTNDTSLQTQINTIRNRDHVLIADVSKGYIKFTDGSMICWGVISFSTAGYQPIIFGAPFANTNYAISFGYVSDYTGTGGMGRRENVADTYSTTGFRVYATEAKGNKTYIAVGKYL